MALLFAAIVFFAIEAVFIIALPAGDLQVSGVNLAGDLVALCAVVALGGLYKSIPVEFKDERKCWLLLFLGVLIHWFGDLAWSFLEIVANQMVPVGGLVDVLYLAGYFFLAAGLFFFVTRVFFIEKRLMSVAVAILSAMGLFVCLGLLSWGVGEGLSFVLLIQNFYVAADVVLIALMLLILIPLFGAQEHAAVFWLVFGVSFVMLFAYDIGFAFLTAKDAYFTGHLIDVFYGASYLGFVLAVAWKLRFFDRVGSND